MLSPMTVTWMKSSKFRAIGALNSRWRRSFSGYHRPGIPLMAVAPVLGMPISR